MINIVASSRYKMNKARLKFKTGELLDSYQDAQNKTLNLIFVGKNKMRTFAKKYKHENEALPVLSFSYDKEEINPEKLMGEIFICYPQAVLLAAEREKKVEDILFFLIDHGIKNILSLN